MTGTLTWGTDTIHYEVRFLASRQTLAIEVHPDSRVLVRAPVDCSEALIAERVRKRAAWISRQLREFDRYRPRTPARQYVNGESHLYLGRQYRLKLVSTDLATVSLEGGRLMVGMPGDPSPDQVKGLLRRWYLDRARIVFHDVLHSSLTRFKGIDPPRLAVRTMRSRWGSLSAAGTMTLNASLVRAPRGCIEYVVVHELCHVRHRNHDAGFYSALARAMPDWLERKRALESVLL